MRALVAGLIVLTLAVLVTGTRDEPAREAPPSSLGPSVSSPEAAARTPIADAEPARRALGSRDPAAGTFAKPVASSPSPASARAPAAAEVASASPPGPPPRIRTFTPGSDAHARAIASNLGSAEFRETVSPLARLYFGFFGRFPDQEGLDHYAARRNEGTSLEAIADEFAGSAEFEMRYGRLDNAAFVDRVLRNVGGGDAAQRAAWIAALDAGEMTRGQVMLAFSEGPMFQRRVTNEVFVALAYAETLGRTPDPDGFAHWLAHLRSGGSREAVISGLLASR